MSLIHIDVIHIDVAHTYRCRSYMYIDVTRIDVVHIQLDWGRLYNQLHLAAYGFTEGRMSHSVHTINNTSMIQ